MATLLSPGVYIEEVDASAIVPNVSANVAFLGGNFNDGPVDQAYVVTNKKEYEDTFGTPTNDNYNEWFQGYKFFDYANQLIVSRAFQESRTGITTQISADDLASSTQVYTTTGTLTTGGDNAGGTVGNQCIAIVDVNFGYEVRVGDFLSFGTLLEVGEVWDITTLDATGSGGELSIQITLEMLDPPSGALALLDGTAVMLHSDGHYNGGTQAYLRGSTVDLGGGLGYVPAAANASDETVNIDTTVKAADGTTDVPNDNRLTYSYDLVKNDGDFDYQYDQNELNTFADSMKLKFISKTPNTGSIEIAIANWYDFTLSGTANTNYAIAFEETVGTSTEFTYLTSLFDYSPLEDQIAIAIKKDGEIETFIVSLDPLSVDGNGKNNYIETVINETSNFVYVIDNTSITDMPASYLVCDRFGFLDATASPRTLNTNGVVTNPLTVVGGRSPIVTEGGITDAYSVVEDKERFEIDVIIGNENYPNVAIDLAETRKDCIAYLGARYEDTVGKKAIDATNAIITYINDGDANGVKVTRSMFSAMFVNYFRVYDKYNKKYRWINCAGDMAGIRCDVTSNTASWWVSAGMKRGIVRNINKLAFTPSQPQRDNLYKTGVNPIVSFPGTGSLVWGNKTLYPIASSFDRINVRTLFNTIERSMSKAARSQVFEFNDPYTRNAIMSMFNPYLSTIKAGRGITDYLVVCDETNNTPDVISRNELKVDIYIKPNYAAEMILLTFTNVGTRSFADVVGV